MEQIFLGGGTAFLVTFLMFPVFIKFFKRRNILDDPGGRKIHTARTPAMGGLLLTVRTQEQQVFFPENEACYMYSDIEELKKKIEHIVENKEEANKVRIRGMELVVDHSYTNRVKNLLKELAD